VRAIAFRRVGAHDEPVAGRLGAEPEREVDRLAEADDQVRLRKRLGKIAERGILEAARALHRYDGCCLGVGQARQELARPGRVQRGAGQDQGTLRSLERRPDRRDVVGRRCHRLGPQALLLRQGLGCLGLEHVERQRQMDGAGAPGQGGAHRARRIAPQIGCRGGPKRQFGHGCGHLGLRELLEGAPAVLRDRGGAGQQQHGALRHPRDIERPQRVREAGRCGHEGDARLPGQLGRGVRHEHRSRLVARVDDLDAGIDAGIEDRHDLVARQTENASHAGPCQRLHHDVRTPHETSRSLTRRHPDHCRTAKSTGPPRARQRRRRPVAPGLERVMLAA
jgi:hypothetical protein